MKPMQAEPNQKRIIKALVKQAARPPSNVQECLSLGEQLTQAREWTSAAKCYQAILKKEPQHFQTLMKLGYVQACAGKLKQAVSTYTLCTKLDKQNIPLLNNLAAMCLALNQPHEASRHARAALMLNEKDANSHYFLAESLRILKDSTSDFHYEQALTLFQHVNQDIHTLIKIGRMLRLTNRFQSAVEILNKVIQSNPNIPGAHLELAQLFEQQNETELAKRAYRRTLELAPLHAEALSNYAELMAKAGKLDKTAWAYRRLSRLFPENTSFQHLLKASTNESDSGIDENYIKDVFNDYSSTFEEHLVNTLGYQTPHQLHALFLPYWDETQLKIMDLGCGTGLCGPLFKPFSDYLIGVDLSQGMLEQAKKKKIYDQLILSELISALSSEHQSQDLLIAADVLIYVGELDKLFSSANRALKNKRFLLFSIETKKGSSFKLDISGRYKHSRSYIAELCNRHNFKIIAENEAVLRTESLNPVHGINFLIQKLDPST